MKQALIIGIIYIMGILNTDAALATGWGAQITGAYLYDSLGTLLDSGVNTHQIQLVIDADNNTDMSQLMSGYVGLTGDVNGWDSYIDSTATDDVVWTADMRTWLDGGGGVSYFLEDDSFVDDTYASSAFYFRWFNADSQANATEAGIIYGDGGVGNLSGWVLAGDPTDPNPPVVALDYDTLDSLGTEYTLGVNDGWQTIAPVPEPGTMALFALGLATLGVSRRRRKVQA